MMPSKKQAGIHRSNNPGRTQRFSSDVLTSVSSSLQNIFSYLSWQSIVGFAACLLIALVVVIGALAGVVAASPVVLIVVVILLLAMAVLFLARDRRSVRALHGWAVARPFVIIAAVPVGFCLLEIPSNQVMYSINLLSLFVNLLILAAIFAVIYFIGQRCRAVILVFLVPCLLMGIANHFLVDFKGYPLTPADFLALSTAAEVSSGYSMAINDSILIALVIFVGYCVLLAFIPKVRITPYRVIASSSVAVVVAVCFGICTATVDIEEACGYEINTWELDETYNAYGTALCFLGLIQNMAPNVPEGYQDGDADSLLIDKIIWDKPENTIDNVDDLAVITVMNETFSDLSAFPGLEDSEAYPSLFYEIADDSLESGTAYASTFGGGTCNSEFEYLTGETIGLIGDSYLYPYTMYDLTDVDNLAAYFSSLGYATHAVHPGAASNWRRDVVYKEFGFDDFADETAFEDSETLRYLPTDRATYDYVLDLLDQDSGPQFIFDVTIQNHGGYETGEIDKDEMPSIILPDGSTSAELNEYVACIKHSEEDLAYLVNELNKLDRPVVLCFFGDHQPSLSDWLYEDTHDGMSSIDGGLEEVQTEYAVPYLIWANNAARGDDGSEEKIYGAASADDEGDVEDNEQYSKVLTGEESEGEYDEDFEGESEKENIYGDKEVAKDESSEDKNAEDEEYSESDEDGLAEDAESEEDSGDESEKSDEDEEEVEQNVSERSIISLNYLGARMLSYTSLPLTSYQKFLLKMRVYVPVITLNGYLTRDGIWHTFSDSTVVDGLLHDYAVVQYANLFG